MRFKKGSKVEVLCKKEVPSGSWRCAEIICVNSHNYTVRYDGRKVANCGTFVESVSRKAVRPCPPPLEVSENWVAGDVVEVFDNFSWKMATVSQVLRENHFLVRLLGSSLEFEVFKFDIRVRQSWQDDKWVVIGKGSGSFEGEKRDKTSTLKCKLKLSFQNKSTRTNQRVKDDHFPVKNRFNFQESHVVSSKTLKRASPYCYSQAEEYTGVSLKFRATEKEGRCHRVEAANSSTLPLQVDAVAFPRNMQGENFKNASPNNRTTGIPEVDVATRRQTGTVGCSFANLESNFADDVTCSVGSCSITSNSSYKVPHNVSTGCIKDGDCHFSDAESSFWWKYEEGNCLLPTKGELAAEIHRLELHAYRCTIEALHASGPLSWEQEELMTNLRLSLHISNDEHLMELRNLSSSPCIRIR
ncbi:hypothetical protein I3843_03G222800 [Carya illinoinensis]|nr:hypothetical protein I3760_03G230900 [Carya illinoinensis]KAG2718688.1 hypothetical protein I3760_03G230900 [Carya illinoinensis]KAG2718694.1 hypothetical protein I3760_03G230900 [Carya illinoinensis]KAG7989149.1 hypothetical protein I3843_03G222800 [Carya illinoinensis]KAG7989150.1 hypothetical protein I3843_03G222800 [Carya illinoinensis]